MHFYFPFIKKQALLKEITLLQSKQIDTKLLTSLRNELQKK